MIKIIDILIFTIDLFGLIKLTISLIFLSHIFIIKKFFVWRIINLRVNRLLLRFKWSFDYTVLEGFLFMSIGIDNLEIKIFLFKYWRALYRLFSQFTWFSTHGSFKQFFRGLMTYRFNLVLGINRLFKDLLFMKDNRFIISRNILSDKILILMVGCD